MWYKLNILTYSDENNRAYPGGDGSLVKNRVLFFEDMMYDDFWEPKPIFDFIAFETPLMHEQEDWILLDAHEWIGEYPNKMRSFIISERLMKILNSYMLNQSTFYPGKLKFKNEFYSYFVFHTLRNGWDKIIDVDRSNFTEWDSIDEKKVGINNYSIVSFNDYKLKDKNLRKDCRQKETDTLTLGPDKIVFTQPVDLVLLPKLSWVISQRLKDAIESEGITGLEITPIDNVEFVGGQ